MKKLLALLVFILLGVWLVRADHSDWLFCMLKKDQVTISLKQSTWYYKCHDTIVSLEYLIVETAKDLIKIQTYINKGRDLEYRKMLQTQKQALLDSLLFSRITILTNIKTFEANLLQKSIQYFIIKVTPYKIRLQKSLVKIQALSGFATPELNAYELLLKTQVSIIEKISTIKTKEELSFLLAQYVYLKKIIEWKSE